MPPARLIASGRVIGMSVKTWMPGVPHLTFDVGALAAEGLDPHLDLRILEDARQALVQRVVQFLDRHAGGAIGPA